MGSALKPILLLNVNHKTLISLNYNGWIGSPSGGEGATMATTMGRLIPTTDENRVDYGPLLGFGPATVRVDPHTHTAAPAPGTNLREMVEIIRAKPEEPKENSP